MNFENFDVGDAILLKRISSMLQKYPHIKPEDYFRAPFVINPNDEYFDLSFFAGMGGVNAYTMYMKYIQELDPDNPLQLDLIKDSLRFIGSFCVKHKIALKDYPNYKTGITYDWMKHLKQHQISVYALMDFAGINDIIMQAQEDEKELFLGDVGKKFLAYKTKYLNSTLARELVEKGMCRVQNVIDKKE